MGSAIGAGRRVRGDAKIIFTLPHVRCQPRRPPSISAQNEAEPHSRMGQPAGPMR
jgi:hypothetical protein